MTGHECTCRERPSLEATTTGSASRAMRLLMEGTSAYWHGLRGAVGASPPPAGGPQLAQRNLPLGGI